MDLYNATKECFRQKGLRFEEDSFKDERIIKFGGDLQNGERTINIVSFREFDIQIFISYIHLNNSYKKLECLELINEFNNKFRYGKLYLDDSNNFICVIDIPVIPDNINFSPNDNYIQNIITVIALVYKALEDYYSKFMKAQWS